MTTRLFDRAGVAGTVTGAVLLVALPGDALAISENALAINAEFERLARDAATMNRSLSRRLCTPVERKRKVRNPDRLKRQISFSCRKKVGGKNRGLTITLKLNSYSYDHPTIAMQNSKRYNIPVRKKDQRKDWFSFQTHVGYLWQRKLHWNHPRRSAIHTAKYVGELRQKFFDVLPDHSPLDDSKPQAIRIATTVKFTHEDMGKIGSSADRLAQSIGTHVLNSLAVGNKRLCEGKDPARLSAGARAVYEHACHWNYTFSRKLTYPRVKLALYLKDEDGNVPVIRTGYETELYRRLKNRLVNQEVFKQLPVGLLYNEAVLAMLTKIRGNDRSKTETVNIFDALLTTLNVTRLLARPEQWAPPVYPKTYAGQDRRRDDSALPIFQDLMGVRSVDEYPTFLDYIQVKNNAARGRTHRARRFDHQTVFHRFFGRHGVLQWHRQANRAHHLEPRQSREHWNAGIHYYYWTGAAIQWLGDDALGGGGGESGVAGAKVYEWLQKTLLGDRERGEIQLNQGLIRGAAAIRKMSFHLRDIERFDKRMVRP